MTWRGVDLNYNFECDWLIELADNTELSDNNLASELVENRSFLSLSQEEIIFMINKIITSIVQLIMPNLENKNPLLIHGTTMRSQTFCQEIYTGGQAAIALQRGVTINSSFSPAIINSTVL